MAKRLNHGKMSHGIMKTACKALGIKPGNGVVATASVLTRHFTKNTEPKTDLSECTTCGGKSDLKLPSCPYCGDEGKIEEVAPTDDAPVKGEVVTTGETLADAPAAEPEPVAPVALASRSSDPEVSAALAAEKSPEELALDEAVRKVAENRKRSAEAIWELGHAIREIYSRELWLHRRGTSGKPIYKQWGKFCEAELGISRPMAYELMDVAQTFSLDQIRKYGATKLGLVVKLPEKERTRLLEQFGGAGKRTLAEEVRKTKAKRTPTDPNPEPRVVSVLVRMGEAVVVPLYRAGLRAGRHPTAKSLADNPFGTEKHGNGLETRYAIRADEKTGALELVIERRRA